MNTFSNAVKNVKSSATTRTENGMKTWVESDSKVLDLFGTIGNARKLDITDKFMSALAEDENLAVRVLLWARDVRSGSGERKTFRSLLQALEVINPALAGKIMHKIPLLGRADDLFSYQDPINRKAAFEMYEDGLYAGNGLFAKWAPREKSAKSALAKELREFMGLTPKAYRKLLVSNTNVVESQMCAKQWDEINFSHVPSVAASRYQKAFTRNSKEKYAQYIRELQKPESERDPKVKINATSVYPYEIVKAIDKGNAAVANAQFDALPDFVGNSKILPIIDTSASMTWIEVANGVQPYHVAMSLGLYLSSKTSSDFKDMVMHFSNDSKIEVLKGSLSQKLQQMKHMVVHGSTNLHAAFDVLLKTAISGNVAPENMPTHLLILSDMEFDSCVRYDDNAIQMIRRKYETAGYKAPTVIFWKLNVCNVNAGSPVKTNDKGVGLVSGFSPAIMASVLGSNPDEFTPYNLMLKTIMNPIYDFE